MHVISRARLKEAAAKYPDIESALDVWYRAAKHEEWSCLEDVRKTYRHADIVNDLTGFNIKGNRYRLIAKIEYQWKKVFIKHVLSHAEYS